jgi:excisionase family DNA binding protein
MAFLSDCLKGLPKEKPDTLTPPQVARILGVNPDKVLGWIRSGELKAANLARRQGGRPKYRIAEEDLQAFKNRRAVQPRQKPNPRPAWHGKTYF